MSEIGERIAEIMLSNGFTKVQPDKPFLWACGKYMPIYNDNRMLLSQHEYRELVTTGLANIVSDNSIGFDMIAGTTTAGIAPAAMLANHFGVPMVISHNNKFYIFSQDMLEKNAKIKTPDNIDVVASTCPTSIIPGVTMADFNQIPFAYVRQSAKSHGTKQQIEGLIHSGERIYLLNHHVGDSYEDAAVRAIEEKGANVSHINVKDISNLFDGDDISDRKILMVEDLISMGGSSVKEIQQYREKGAIIDNCLSIFSYELPQAIKAFEDANCNRYSVLDYPDTLLKVGVEKGHIKQEQLAVLRDWRENDYMNWGERHRFFAPEKK